MAHSHYFIIVLSSIVALTTSFNHPCTSEDLSGCLFNSVQVAQRNNSREISIILLPHIWYVLNNSFKVDGDFSLFEIISNGTSRVKINRQNDSNLVFLNINQIILRKLSFGEGEDEFQEKFYPFLSINNSESIIIKDCKFDKILGNAMSIYVKDLDKDFYLLIESSHFYGTRKPKRPSQGIYIQLQNTSSANVTVTRCIFQDFKIDNSTSFKVLTAHQRMLYRPLAFEQSYNINSGFHKSFTLSYSKFENNDAYVGGGMGVYTSHASNSSYYITHCEFLGNRVVRQVLGQSKSRVDVSGSGGGIAALLFDCESCNFNLSHCTFTGNHAALGGGVKVGYYFRSPQVNININQSSFLHNKANSGSGLYIEAQLVQPAIPQQATLRNLNFSNNVAYDFGAGIFVAYLPLRLEGDGITFLNNINTSFSVISSQIEVYTNLNFTNNNGSRGGALFLSDNSQLLLDQNVNLYFVKNRASDKGGAIYADSISLDLLYRNYGYTFYNVHCFIKHFIKFNTSIPDNYTQSIYFQYNEAPVGSAIYTHTLSPCSWYSNVTPYSAIDKALRWATYHYESKDPNKHDIATAVAHYNISQYEDSSKNSTHPVVRGERIKLEVVPGQSSQIVFKATDQLNYPDVSIATVQPEDDSQVSPCNGQGDGSIFLTSSSTEPVEVMFCGRPGTSGKVSFKALDGLTIEKTILVYLKECPIGEFWNETDRSCDKYSIAGHETLWKCNVNTSLIRVPGLLRNGNNDTFVSITCPTTYCEPAADKDNSKVDCSNQALGEKCVPGRLGIGCSSCSPGKYMMSGSLVCTQNCDLKTTTITTVFLIILLLVLISVLFLIRSSSYLDSHIHLRETLFPYARSFIFFCQGTFILYLNTFDKKEKNLSNFITKTGFFFTYDLCFSLGFTDTRGRVFEEYFFYLIGFVAILLLALLVNCVVARFLPIRFKYSVISYAFVSYSFLTFTPIAFTTLRLLSCGTLTTYSSTRGDVSHHYKIWYYDSTQSCYGTNADILITSTAFIVLFLYIIPLPVTYFLLALYGERPRKVKVRPTTLSKFKGLLKILNAISTEYLSSFPKSSFGFWIPITMLSYLTLLVIQTNGPLFKIESDNQPQLMAVICFFFLYIRVSLKISDDIFVQLYDAISIFFLCISCIFLIIYDNNSDKYSSHLFESLIKYFPLAAYVILFLAILLFPIIKYFWTKQKNVAAENEDKKENSALNPIVKSFQAESIENDEVDDLEAPLLGHDHLDNPAMHTSDNPAMQTSDNPAMQTSDNPAMQTSLPFQRDAAAHPISANDSYASNPYHSSGTPGENDPFDQVDLNSLELSDHAQMREK